MSDTTSRTARAARATRRWAQGRANRRAVAQFGQFWQALQHVGDVLHEAERAAKNADDKTGWRGAGRSHWDIATAQEVRAALKGCRVSLRIVSAQAKRFEPHLIMREWRR